MHMAMQLPSKSRAHIFGHQEFGGRTPLHCRIVSKFCLRKKSQSAKCWMQWSGLPCILTRLDQVMAILDTRLATAGQIFSSRKTAQKGNKSRFPGAMCVFRKCRPRPKSQCAKLGIRWPGVLRISKHLD